MVFGPLQGLLRNPRHPQKCHSGAYQGGLQEAVKEFHPDKNPSPEAEEMFKLINEAY
jgi:hypothetical protein